MNETPVWLLYLNSVLIGALSSVIASCICALYVLCLRASDRRQRARPFEGTYTMLNPSNNQSRGGTVTIKHKHSFWDASPILSVIAKHTTGEEDWSGFLEVGGLSDIARGYYRHRNQRGGALKLTLAGDSEILEEGKPHDAQFPQFEKLLRRVGPAVGQGRRHFSPGEAGEADARRHG